MAKNNSEKKGIEVRDFYSVYSRAQVREVDARIVKAQHDYDARERKAMATAKDFVISH